MINYITSSRLWHDFQPTSTHLCQSHCNIRIESTGHNGLSGQELGKSMLDLKRLLAGFCRAFLVPTRPSEKSVQWPLLFYMRLIILCVLPSHHHQKDGPGVQPLRRKGSASYSEKFLSSRPGTMEKWFSALIARWEDKEVRQRLEFSVWASGSGAPLYWQD